MEYCVSKETFDAMPEELQKQVMQDTKSAYKMDEGMKDEGDEADMKLSPKEEQEAMEAKASMDEEEKKNSIKDFDEAGDKGLALMIGIGKLKDKMKGKAKESPVADEEA